MERIERTTKTRSAMARWRMMVIAVWAWIAALIWAVHVFGWSKTLSVFAIVQLVCIGAMLAVAALGRSRDRVGYVRPLKPIPMPADAAYEGDADADAVNQFVDSMRPRNATPPRSLSQHLQNKGESFGASDERRRAALEPRTIGIDVNREGIDVHPETARDVVAEMLSDHIDRKA